MPLREKINEQFNFALKSKNKNLVSTLRLVLAAIKDQDIAKRTKEKKEIILNKMPSNRLIIMLCQNLEVSVLYQCIKIL